MAFENRGYDRGRAGIVATTRVEVPGALAVPREYEFAARFKVTIPEDASGTSFLRTLLQPGIKLSAMIDEVDKDDLRFEGELVITSPITLLSIGG